MITTGLKVFFFIIGAWIGVHIFGLLGVPITLAYFFLWLIRPNKSICILCRNLPDGDYCSFCKRNINKSETIRPHSFRSVVLNTLLLAAISICALLIMYVEARFISSIPQIAIQKKSAEFAIPSVKEHAVGELFTFVIKVENLKTPINAVKIDLGYDPSLIEIVDFSTQQSFATIFIEKQINNQLGFARLSGGIPNPGFSADTGVFAVAYLKGKSPGLAKVQFLPSSLILANDGKGTNVINKLDQANFLITAEKTTDYTNTSLQTENGFSPVLGAEIARTRDDQFIFYDESDVLGIATPSSTTTASVNSMPIEDSQPKQSILRKLIEAVYAFDRAVLNFFGIK